MGTIHKTFSEFKVNLFSFYILFITAFDNSVTVNLAAELNILGHPV